MKEYCMGVSRSSKDMYLDSRRVVVPARPSPVFVFVREGEAMRTVMEGMLVYMWRVNMVYQHVCGGLLPVVVFLKRGAEERYRPWSRWIST
jgi:hypothetical protein